MALDVVRDGEVFVLAMGDDDTAFTPKSVRWIGELLDEVEAASPPSALVTIGTGKTYSTGLDLAWVQEAGATSREALVRDVEALIARTLVFPRPTVAAVNGHCFGAGAAWSLAHDFRVMREDRGFWCLPEVDVGVPFTDGAVALVTARLDAQVAHEAMTTARRYGGAEAVRDRIVDAVADEASLQSRAVEVARGLAGTEAGALAATKAAMYRDVVRRLHRE